MDDYSQKTNLYGLTIRNFAKSNAMRDNIFNGEQRFRFAEEAKSALEILVARLRGTGRIGFKGAKLTQEAFVSALWLWAGDQDPEAVLAIIEPYVRKLESFGETAAGDPSATAAKFGAHPIQSGKKKGPGRPPGGTKKSSSNHS